MSISSVIHPLVRYFYSDLDQAKEVKYNRTTRFTYGYTGDVVALMDTGGNIAVRYSYDPWGKVTAVTNASGAPYAVRHSTNSGSSWTTYYYILNLQGDVVALMNTSGSIVAKYTYDAWGKVTAVTNGSGTAITDSVNIANANPIRYRGYYYDTESSLYYLQSRYYDPETGRFINADGYLSTGHGIVGYNMFAYCNSDPIDNCDPYGNTFIYSGFKRLGGGVIAYADTGTGTPSTVNITNKLDNAMKNNAETLKEYKDSHSWFEATQFFIEKVKPGGDWDFKSQDDWALSPEVTYFYNETELRYDDIGNIHYGYVGRVLFDTDLLLIAGGVVQIGTGTSQWAYWKSNFDDPRDQWAIQFGCELWDQEVEARK